MKVEFNINENIKVQLTKHGKGVLKKHFKTNAPVPYNGYYNFSFWEFASIFGKEFYNGQMNPSIVNNKIIIQKI